MSKRTDIIIPLGPSEIDHIDLRYALRSIEKNVKNYRDIWIIGTLPEWIQNVKHIPFSDAEHPKWKEKNIKDKYTAACMTPEISQVFAAFNDDHFILSEIDISTYPFYYKGTCGESVKANKSSYKKTMKHTQNFLLRRGFRDRNADTHTPILYDKKKFLNSFTSVEWMTPWGYGIKSIYCAVNKVDMEYMADCKFKGSPSLETVIERSKDRHIISCDENSVVAGVGQFMELMFPEKSRYEK